MGKVWCLVFNTKNLSLQNTISKYNISNSRYNIWNAKYTTQNANNLSASAVGKVWCLPKTCLHQFLAPSAPHFLSQYLLINSQALIWLHFLATDFTNHNSISGAYLLLIVCRGCLIKLSQKKSLKRSSFAEKYGNGKIWLETVWSKLTDRPGAPVSTSYNMV